MWKKMKSPKLGHKVSKVPTLFFLLQITSQALAYEVLCSSHEFNMAIVHLKTCSIQEPREIQQRLLNGADFCSEINDLLFRCVSPLKACLDKAGINEVATALLHDIVPLDKPLLFKNIKQGLNCTDIGKTYAAKSAQPILQSKVCNHVESWENRHEYESCKERANVAMKLKLAQHRGQREILMKNVCATVDRLVACGRKLHQCLTTSEISLINASMLDNLETLLNTLKHKTGFEPSFCKAFGNKMKRPEMMDRIDDQPVRLASPSINVLDYSNRRGNRGRSNNGTRSHASLPLLAIMLLYSIIKIDIT